MKLGEVDRRNPELQVERSEEVGRELNFHNRSDADGEILHHSITTTVAGPLELKLQNERTGNSTSVFLVGSKMCQ